MDAAFEELGGVISDHDNDDSNMEVYRAPEDAVPVDDDGEQNPAEDSAEDPAEDFAAMSVEELEARIVEAEKSLEVEGEDGPEAEPAKKERKLSQHGAAKANKKYVPHKLGFKLKALRSLQENTMQLRATARQLGLKDPKTLRDRRDQKDAIIAEVRDRLHNNQRATARCRIKGGTKAFHQELEVHLVAWLDRERKVRSVRRQDLWDEARDRVKALRKNARLSHR